MKRLIVLALLLSLLPVAAGAGEWTDLPADRVPMYTSGETSSFVWYPRKPFYEHYHHPWPVRWYDAAVKWFRAHAWWPAGEVSWAPR